MKKIFALALAAVMTAGMTTVAFAAADPVTFVGNGERRYGIKDDDGVYTVVDSDDMKDADFDGGDEVALFLFEENSYVQDKDALDRYKVSVDWNVGKLEDKPKIEMVKAGACLGYVYAVTFTLPDSPEIKEADLAGTVTVYKSTDGKKEDAAKFEVGLSYGYNANDYVVDGDDDLTEKNAVKFDYDDVAVLTFGDLEFEVDLTGQGKLNVKNNTDFDKEFAAMYDYANIDFITFEYAPSFNKTGVVYIYADEDAFIYEVTADGAKAIKGLEWDPDYEAWTFKTRTLGSYAISDVELDEKTVTEDKTDDSSKTDDGVKENPDTGR